MRIDDLAGLARRRPWSALALAICMLSLLGFPGTVGFIGKWYILQTVVAYGQYILPVVLVLTSVVSAGYYLPVIMAMYMKPEGERTGWQGVVLWRTAGAVVAVAVLGIVALGVLPGRMIDTVLETAMSLTVTQMPMAGR